MSDIKNGGPAFPVPAGNYSGGESWSSDEGMSLRDYFAGQTLAGMLADPNVRIDPAGLAKTSYDVADAMLKERSKGTP